MKLDRRTGAVCLLMSLAAATAVAGPREQAKRMHDRLAGVPPTESVLANMAADIAAGNALAAAETVNEAPRQYLNRLSDLLFVLARGLNRANLDGLGGDDVYWRSERLARDTD